MSARGKGPARFGDETRHSFRCWPTDIDNYMHMNNSRYSTIADVGRIELFQRSGMWDLGKTRNWWPMMGGGQTAFIKEIKLWHRFELVSSMETWEDRQILGLHRFLLEDGSVAAIVRTSIGVFDYTNRRYVPIDEVAQAIGTRSKPREPDEGEREFLRSNAALRAMARSAKPGLTRT